MDSEVCLDTVNKLEAIQKNKLKDSLIAQSVARFMYEFQRHRTLSGEYLNSLVEGLLANQSNENESRSATGKLTPDSLLTSDYLAYLLNPAIEIIRNRHKSLGGPLFKEYDEAIKWLEGQEASEEECEFLEGKRHLLYEVSGNGSKKLLKQRDLSPLSLFLPHAANGRPRYIHPRKGSALSRLVRVANEVSAQTGLTPISVVMYIIADIKPVLTTYSCGGTEDLVILPAENGKTKLSRRHLNITINTELSFNELLALYKSIKGFLGVTKSKTLSNKHLELYQIVQRHGSPPKGKGTVSFWNLVKNEWNTANPSDQYRSWKAVKIAYDRIIEKLNSRFQIRPWRDDIGKDKEQQIVGHLRYRTNMKGVTRKINYAD